MKKKNISKKNKKIFNFFNLEMISDYVSNHIQQGVYIVIFILCLSFVLVIAKQYYSNRREKLMTEYYKAITLLGDNKVDEAKIILNNIYNETSNNTIKMTSGIRLADLLLRENDVDGALNIYKTIYGLRNIDKFMKNFAGLAALNLLIGKNDTSLYKEIENLISSLSIPSNPVLNLVVEQEGLFEIQRGNKEKGLDILNNLLKQPDLDNDTMERVQAITSLYEGI